jgi:hypothetical protein
MLTSGAYGIGGLFNLDVDDAINQLPMIDTYIVLPPFQNIRCFIVIHVYRHLLMCRLKAKRVNVY